MCYVRVPSSDRRGLASDVVVREDGDVEVVEKGRVSRAHGNVLRVGTMEERRVPVVQLAVAELHDAAHRAEQGPLGRVNLTGHIRDAVWWLASALADSYKVVTGRVYVSPDLVP